MVSFSCEACGDVLTKKKLDTHRNQCRGSSFTCLDCMVHFQGTEYRSHTACISEAQKYQGHLYKDKEKRANKGEKRRSLHPQDDGTMVPQKAYFEEVPDEGENAIAVIDVPPRAPTPPAVEALQANMDVNVFDYLITDDQPESNGHSHSKRKLKALADARHTQHSQRADTNSQRLSQGYTYGNAPVQPGFERFDSWSQLPPTQDGSLQHSQPAELKPAYITQIVTPGPEYKTIGRDDKSDKKRKRGGYVDDLNLSSFKHPSSREEPMTAAPSRLLHTGLTGGLTRLVTDSSFYEDRIDAGPTPISPIKRNKREKDFNDAGKRVTTGTSSRPATTRHNGDTEDHHRSKRREHDYPHDDNHRPSRRHRSPSSSSDDHGRTTRRTSKLKAIDFKPHDSRNSSVQPVATNQLVAYRSRAELFLSFVTKGPDSERGCSINKALKRYHRERPAYSDEKDDDDKELWKSLRLRRNDRGEIVLFIT